MNCWVCDRPAHGTCQFCGRALCKDHVRSLPHILEIYHNKGGGSPQALVVADALYCGLCRPRGEPVDLSELEK